MQPYRTGAPPLYDSVVQRPGRGFHKGTLLRLEVSKINFFHGYDILGIHIPCSLSSDFLPPALPAGMSIFRTWVIPDEFASLVL